MKTPLPAFGIVLLVACSSNQPSPFDMAQPDSGNPDDVGAMGDVGAQADTGTVPVGDSSIDGRSGSDTGAGLDTGGSLGMDTGEPDGGMGAFGTCGATTNACLCAAGGSMSAQAACYTTNMACGACLSMAVSGCCPSETAALNMCDTAMGCGGDSSCDMAMCPTQYSALLTCFSTGQMSDPTCIGILAGCFGVFPLACGG